MQPGKEAERKFEDGFMVPAPSAKLPPQPSQHLSPGFSQPQSQQHRPMYHSVPQVANNMTQPHGVMVDPPQGVPFGYQQPTAVVYTAQQHGKPPCCGTRGVCILDFFSFLAPTLVSPSFDNRGSLAPIIFVGVLHFTLPVIGFLCSRGELSPGKATFLQCYKWYRLVTAIIMLIGAAILLIIGIALTSGSNNKGVSSSVSSTFALAIGLIIIIIGILVGIPGVALLSTFSCYSRDLRIRIQTMALTMQSGFQAQIQTSPVIVAN